MKATGIVRRIDELGRVVIPKELRRVYELNEGDPLEIFVDEDAIVLKKYEIEAPKCKHCATTKSLHKVGSSYICRECSIEAYAAAMEV